MLILTFSPSVLSEETPGPDTKEAALESAPLNCVQDKEKSTQHFPPPVFEEDEINNTNVSADDTRSHDKGNTEFKGNVVIEQNELRIKADNASYNQDTGIVNVKGNVHVDTTTMSLDADSGFFSKDNKSTEFNNAEFYIEQSGLRGRAGSISSDDGSETILKNTQITSCDPQDPGWRFDAELINLDLDDEYGNADDVTLRFQEVPFLYLPYMEFPIGDRRRSGLLAPEFGRSKSRGTEIDVPWYWNIAPNQDATLSPHHMSRRGNALDAQYRFLTETTKGQVDGTLLPNDEQIGGRRHEFQYQQKTRFTPEMNLKVDVQDVSDTEYLKDFGSNLSISSTTHLKREAKYNYELDYWQARAMVQTFETLDTRIRTSKRPYRRLPQLTLRGDQPISDAGLALTIDSEFVEFEHEDDTVVTGSRTTIKPGIHWLTGGSFWFIDPAVRFSYTQYDVADGSDTKLDLKDRKLPISSLDAGLLFDRELESGLTQTLEPRIFYLHVPFRDQNALPDFDTSLPTFNTVQLFSENRFNGGDRIGDANQLTVALSSRLIDPATGNEIIHASIGQIIYFDDREVTLKSTPPETSNRSDLIGEIGSDWEDWSMTSSIQWNLETHESERANFLLHYQSDNEHIFNLGLRTDRTNTKKEIRQTDVSFVTPLFGNFSAVGRWNYSILDDEDIEVIGGITYDSCCWSLQLLGQRHLNLSARSNDEYDNSIMVQLVFKGVGSVSGNSARNTLRQSILGYDEEY